MSAKCRLITAKDGNKVPVITHEGKEVRLGSLYDGRYAAERWAKAYLPEGTENVILFGLGDGQLVLLELERIMGRIYVYEPNENLYREMRHTSVFKKIQASGRVHIYVGENQLEGIEIAVEGLLDDNFTKTTVTQTHYGYFRCYPKEVKKVYDICMERVAYVGKWKNSFKIATPKATPIQLAVVRNIKGGILLTRLARVWNPSVPVIIASAGPSLEKNVELLKRANGRAYIFCVDAAASMLLSHDVVPDLIACMDSGKNPACFADERSKEIPMLVAVSTTTKVFGLNHGKKIWTNIYGFVRAMFEICGIEWPTAMTSLGVATVLLAALLNLGTKRIVFVGQDLAYSPEGKSHISGHNEGMKKNKKYMADGYYGGKVWSRFDWVETRKCLESLIELAPDREFINATEGGARISGTLQKPLSAVIDELETTVVPLGEILRDESLQLSPHEYEWLKNEFFRGMEDLNLIRQAGYEQVFFRTDYRQFPVMRLICDYMAILDDEDRRVRFEKAADIVYKAYQKEMEQWKE